MSAPWVALWTSGRRNCGVCGHATGTKSCTAKLAVEDICVEGWPTRGRWGHYKQGTVLCAIHATERWADESPAARAGNKEEA